MTNEQNITDPDAQTDIDADGTEWRDVEQVQPTTKATP